MNFEYTEDELQDFDKPSLLKIARDYNLKINKNTKKLDIITEILNHQEDIHRSSTKNIKTSQRRKSVTINKFNNLPADILRLLAFYLSANDIVYLCRLNKKIKNIICCNQRFLRELGHLRLTDKDERLVKKNILKELRQTRDFGDAVKKGYLILFESLISKGLPLYIDARELFANSLTEAAEAGYLDIVEYLIKKGADVHAVNDRALRFAAREGHLAVVQYLVSQGANIHAYDDAAVNFAATHGRLATVKYLVEQGADVHAGDDIAVRMAAEKGHLDVVKYLVSEGADIHAQNDDALRYAAYKGHQDVVKYLKSLK